MLLFSKDFEEKIVKALVYSERLIAQGRLKEEDGLLSQLHWLSTYANTPERLKEFGQDVCHVWLSHDFAAHSFSLMWYTLAKPGKGLTESDWDVKERQELLGYTPWFNGGLIFHGSHDRGGDGGAPTFSVNLTPVNGWSVHT